jgi:hypothetical protein
MAVLVVVPFAPDATVQDALSLRDTTDGPGFFAFKDLPTTVEEWYRNAPAGKPSSAGLLGCKDGPIKKLFAWSETVSEMLPGANTESLKKQKQ